MVRKISLIIASISFIVVIGAGAYEHLAVVPVWASAPPVSLTMFQGPYALAPQNFWVPVHPVTIVLFILALVLNWRTERRSFIVVTLTGYLLVLAITAVYFVPELLSITQSAYSTTADADLASRASRWETLSIARLAFMIVLAFVLLYGLSIPAERRPTYVS